MKLKIFFGMIILLVLLVPGVSAIPAFPGAEGGGATATGGRGGQTIIVSNLNASGDGSLYAALTTPGARTIVFNVSGIINLGGSNIDVINGDVTVAGQTSPGYGILIRNGRITLNSPNIIIRYITLRSGVGTGNGDIISVRGFNHILDHVSISWGNDDLWGIWNYGSGFLNTDNITLQYSILGEGFADMNNPWAWHATSINIGAEGDTSTNSPYFYNTSIHHNLISQSNQRMPQVKSADVSIINNIIYNGRSAMSMFAGGGEFDFIGNKYKNLILNTGQKEIGGREKNGVNDMGLPGYPSVYVYDNMNISGSIPSDQWTMVSGAQLDPIVAPATWKRLIQKSNDTYPITIHSVSDIDSVVLPTVGNSRYINDTGMWVERNDIVDDRHIQDYQAGTGQLETSETVYCTTGCTNGYPTYYYTTPYADSDRDGISDTWEIANGLNPNNAADAIQYSANGYTNLENFINGEDVGADLPVPVILTQYNNKTNDNSTSVTINQSEYITFNFTANQTVTGIWTKDGSSYGCSGLSCTMSWSTNGTKTVTAYGTNSNGSTSTVTWTLSILPVPSSKIGIGGASWTGHATFNNLYPDNEYVKPGIYRDDFNDGAHDFINTYSGNATVVNNKLKVYGEWVELYKVVGNYTDVALFLKINESNVSAQQIFGARSDTSRVDVGYAYRASIGETSGFANITMKYTNGTLFTINSSSFTKTNNVESSYVFKTCGNNQKLYASNTSSYETALANLIGSGTNNLYSNGNRIYMQLNVVSPTESNLIDDLRVLKTDSSCNILHSGNLTANYEAASNNVIESIIVNASSDADYTLEYRQYPSSGAWISLGTNLSGNQTKSTNEGYKYQNTEIRITSYFNDTSSQSINTLEFLETETSPPAPGQSGVYTIGLNGNSSWAQNATLTGLQINPNGKLGLIQAVLASSKWKLDEASGTSAADENTTNARTLTHTGVTVAQSGKYGYSAQYTGTNSYSGGVNIASGSSGTTMAWIKPSDWTNNQMLMGAVASNGADVSHRYTIHLKGDCGTAWGTIISNGATYQVACSTTTFDSTNFPSSAWTHVAITYNGSFVNFYRNGILTNSVSQTVSGAGDAQPFALGRYGGYGIRYYTGYIDEPAIYTTALTQADIQNAMNNTGSAVGYVSTYHNMSSEYGIYKIGVTATGNWQYNSNNYSNNQEILITNTTNLTTNITVFSGEVELVSYHWQLLSSPEGAFIPPSPINLSLIAKYDYGYEYTFWWVAGSGNKTDYYNYSINNVWTNKTTQYFEYGYDQSAHQQYNVSVYAGNNTYGLNTTPLTGSITMENQVPVISNFTSLNRTIYEGQTYIEYPVCTDIDEDACTWSDNTAKFVINSTTGVISWTTVDGDQGTYYITISVSDGYGGSANQDIMITVLDSTPAPLTTVFNVTTETLYTGLIDLFWWWSPVTNADTYQVVINGSDKGFSGLWWNLLFDVTSHSNVTFSIRSHNNNLNTNSSWYNITTQAGNILPVLSNIGSKTITSGNWLNFTLNATEHDGDSIIYATNATKGVLNSTTGNFNWSTTSGDIGTYTWQFNVTDSYGGSDWENVEILVNDTATEQFTKTEFFGWE